MDPERRSQLSPGTPAEPLDALAWALCIQGGVGPLELRRARWLAGSDGARLLHLLLAARLGRGQGSARLEDLVGDLHAAMDWTPPERWDSGPFAGHRQGISSHRESLTAMLREAAEACGDDPLDLVRKTSRNGAPILAFARFRECEDDLSRRLRDLLAETPMPVATISGSLFEREPRLHERQSEAVRRAMAHRFMVVAGGPGTGKTTVVARILEALEDSSPRSTSEGTILCAPTGRAKARLLESVARQFPTPAPLASSTLHALLGVRPDGSFRHDSGRPLPWSTIVLDEASMVDQVLFAGLLAALHPRSRLLVLGDPDQLPSVEAGGLFADLAAHCETLPEASRPYVRLTHTWRNSGAIRELGEEVNQGGHAFARALSASAGSLPGATETGSSGSVVWLEGDLDDVLARWWSAHAFGGRSDSGLAADLGSSRILCATHHGPAGRERINALGDARLREAQGLPRSPGRVWIQDRPVLLTRNLAALDLWNGDLGLTSVREGDAVVRFPRGDEEVFHSPGRLEGLEAAWAITIHKSQGSEFDHVLLVLPEEDSPLLTRQILYTGLTRARKSLCIFGSPALWEAAVARRQDRSSPLLDLGSRVAP